MITPSGAALATGSRIAGVAAALCGVHCALTPFLVVAAPALAISESAERAVWVATVLVGAVVLLLGPVPRNAAVTLAFAAGAALWGASLAGWFQPAPETATSAAASLVLAGALLWSARICRVGACEVCQEPEPNDVRDGVSGRRATSSRRPSQRRH